MSWSRHQVLWDLQQLHGLQRVAAQHDPPAVLQPLELTAAGRIAPSCTADLKTDEVGIHRRRKHGALLLDQDKRPRTRTCIGQDNRVTPDSYGRRQEPTESLHMEAVWQHALACVDGGDRVLSPPRRYL